MFVCCVGAISTIYVFIFIDTNVVSVSNPNPNPNPNSDPQTWKIENHNIQKHSNTTVQNDTYFRPKNRYQPNSFVVLGH